MPATGGQQPDRNEVESAKELMSQLIESSNPLAQIKQLLTYPDAVLQKAFGVPGNKAVLIDLDGTLYDTDAAQKGGWISACAKLQLGVPELDYLQLATVAYDYNEAIEKGLPHPYSNIRKVWNAPEHYAVIMFLDFKAKKSGLDAAIREFTKALSDGDKESPYVKELDRYITKALKAGNIENAKILEARQAFENYCRTQVKPFEGVHESVTLLKKLGMSVVIATDGNKVTQNIKVRSWLKLGKLFPTSHILCTSNAYPQEAMDFLRSHAAELEEKQFLNGKLLSQANVIKSELLQKLGTIDKREIGVFETLPSYKRLKKHEEELERNANHNAFLKDVLKRLTTKQRLDYYQAAVRAVASSPRDPAGALEQPDYKHDPNPLKVCVIGDAPSDVGVYALNPNIIVVGVLTGKRKYSERVVTLLNPSNTELQMPQRTKITSTILHAIPFLITPEVWRNVKPIENIRHTTTVFSKADIEQAMEIIARSNSSMNRRIAAEMVSGIQIPYEATNQTHKEIILNRFIHSRNPAEQFLYASLLGSMTTSEEEKREFSKVLVRRIPDLSLLGVRSALQSITQIGTPEVLPDGKEILLGLLGSKDNEARVAAKTAVATLLRQEEKRTEAREEIQRQVETLDTDKTLQTLYYRLGEITSLRKEHGLPLLADQKEKIIANYKKLRNT
jgi:phosphoglycolate phosphatase-like HAD superfamily hydrolase